jgi:hypothetical protein
MVRQWTSCLYQAVLGLSVLTYRRSARWPIGSGRLAAYRGAMTTYTTPHFATGLPDRNVRSESGDRARTATAATYRTAGVSNEAAVLADGPTPDWQPGASRGVPKAAIGALGAALVGGIALAVVLMAPSNKVTTKQVLPDPIAQATASNATTQKANDSTEAAVSSMDKLAPAAGNVATDAAATQQAAQAATDAAAPAAPAPVQAVTPNAPPVANAPVARVARHVPAPIATPKVAHQPVQSAPDVAPAPVVAPPADVQPPAMQQTPDSTTVTPLAPTPAPVPDTPAPTPAPAQ